MIDKALLKMVALPIIMALSFLFYKFFPKVKQDNPIEEVAEVIIEATTGEDIDLSPDTPE
jgi:hypothetical protein